MKTNLARELRRRETNAEKALWARLRKSQLEGVKFRRQQPIGPYIVDFASFEKRVIVEIDGGQHNESEVRGRDEERAEWLKEKGYHVLRFWNNEVLVNMEGVLEVIRQALR
ncbi:MAG: endonuclease domain-containing protein [Dehalococcoidia bacterium]|nr:endonuclease domain-containing protein [Dehalococcoidia bacterium]